jgi:hypothetical protein
MRSFRRSICLVSFALTLALASQVEAAWLKVAWDPPSDTLTAGYTVFYGTTPGAYTSQVNAGMVTEYTVEGLVAGTTYYFAIQAYGSNGEFSALSAITEGTTPAKTGGTKGKGGTTRSKPGKGKPSANIVDDSSIEIEWLSETGDVASDSSPAMAAQSATAGVTSYRVEVGVLPGETSYSAVTGALAARFDMADLPADTYFIRVRSRGTRKYRRADSADSEDRAPHYGAGRTGSGRSIAATRTARSRTARRQYSRRRAGCCWRFDGQSGAHHW